MSTTTDNLAKPNIIDRVVGLFSPRAGVNRLRSKREFNSLYGAFEGGKSSYHRGWPPYSSLFGKDEDNALSAYQHKTLVLNIRDMRRNDGIVFGALNRFANGVVGAGLTPVPQTSDKKWNDSAAVLWSKYMKMCDYRNRLHGWEIQRLVVKARMTEGEAGIALIENGQIQPIESERILTPIKFRKEEGTTLVKGFRLSREGRPLGVYVCERNKSGVPDQRKATYVEWENFLHPSISERFDQIRGIPSLTALVNTLRDKKEFTMANLIKAKKDALNGWNIASDEDLQGGNMADRTADQPETGNGVRVEQHDIGQMWFTGTGTKMNSLESKTPNAEYDRFTRSILHEIAMGLDIPYEVLMLDLAKVSFSGGRGILLMAYQTWAIWRVWLVNELLAPWWNWRLGMAIRDGVIAPAPLDDEGVSEWYKVDWNPPELGWVDRKGEADANRKEVELGTKTLAGIARSRATTEDALLDEKKETVQKAITRSIALKEEFPDEIIHWRDIYNPTQTVINLASYLQAEEDDKDEDEPPLEETEDES